MVLAGQGVAVFLAGAELLPDCSASVLGEPVLCAIVESARAWRESMWVALVDLVRANIGEFWFWSNCSRPGGEWARGEELQLRLV